jgi:hypothetical protein|tara:strand:- start:872 stop:1126 length:255 start_codon:yes stop_codon:yes gene_type:complete
MLKNFSTYAIIQTSDLSNIDFDQIGETNENTLRYNLANTEFVIKWNTTPTFISDGTVVPVSTLTHSEALAVMATAEWSEPEPVE